MGVEIDGEGVEPVVTEHVVDARGEPEAGAEAIGEFHPGQGRVVVVGIAGLEAEGFLATHPFGSSRKDYNGHENSHNDMSQ